MDICMPEGVLQDSASSVSHTHAEALPGGSWARGRDQSAQWAGREMGRYKCGGGHAAGRHQQRQASPGQQQLYRQRLYSTVRSPGPAVVP